MLQLNVNEKEKQRIFWIDFVKFLGILFILLNHIGIKLPIVSQFGGMFYVPVFFVLAGYTFRLKEETTQTFIGRKVKRLLVPYFVYSAFLFTFFLIKDGWQLKAILGIFYARNSLHAEISSSETVLMNIANSPLWFLPALFVAEVLFRLAVSAVKNDSRSILLVSAISVFLGICFHYFSPILLPWSLDSAFIFQAMMTTGYLLREKKIIEKFANKWLVWLGAIVLLTILYVTNGPINISIGDYGKILWAGFLMAILSSSFVIIISYRICNIRGKKFAFVASGITCIAQSSISIMCLHMFLFMFLETAAGMFKSFFSMENIFCETVWKLIVVVAAMDIITIGRLIVVKSVKRISKSVKADMPLRRT